VFTKWRKELNNNNIIICVMLDLNRAFETVNRSILIQKLKYYGIDGQVLNWFKSYLCYREQLTRVNNEKSNKIENNFGVPQGSVMGGLIF
jgi:hypothetical protein